MARPGPRSAPDRMIFQQRRSEQTRSAMRVVVYASARKETPSKFLVMAQRLGVELAEKGHVCVNGGGKFGGMGALNKSCKEAGGRAAKERTSLSWWV